MELQPDSFDNKSIEVLLNASLQSQNLQNIEYLYHKACQEIEQGKVITWRSLESFLKTYSQIGKIKECNEIYQKYKELRIKVSTEYNTKYNLSRPTGDIQQDSSFSRLYMLPEPPRDVLYQMAYVYGYNRDVESIRNFFKQDVLDDVRLSLYQYRKQLGLSKGMKLEIGKAQTKINNIKSHKSPQGSTLIRKYKDNISRFNKNLKRNSKTLEVGLSGPVGIVYEGLIEGWKKGVEKLEGDVGSYYIQMDNLMEELVSIEKKNE